MNKAIVDNKVLEAKAEQEAKFAQFAKEQNNADYAKVVSQIDEYVQKATPITKQMIYFSETFRSGIEFGATYVLFNDLKTALQKNKKKDIEKAISSLKEAYADVHNKDYDHEVDRKVAKVLIPLYAESVPVMLCLHSIRLSRQSIKAIMMLTLMLCMTIAFSLTIKTSMLSSATLPLKLSKTTLQYNTLLAKNELSKKLNEKYDAVSGNIDLLHKTYVRGLCEMYAPTPKAPDANFTIRLTYGNVKSYDPKDGIHYKYYTTLKGVMEKEDPSNPEFVVPAKLKELYATKNFGRYALPNGEMPTCFLTTNDITGGNSGSPVLNGNGELIGAAFDGNWESLSGDINFDNNLQRCIAVDIRYVLFIVEKLGGCKNLIDEMTIVE